jgi:hypothetical protein
MSASDCKMIRPLTITDAMLTSSTVPEEVVPTYSGGTTYAAGDRAGPAPSYGDAQTVYESTQSGNVGHAQSDTDWWKVVGVVYPVYASGSSCALGGIVTDLANHLLYESLVSGNTGNALTDTSKWLPRRATNRWKALDDVYNSQTTNADSIVFVIAPGEVVNTVSFLNVAAASVTVEQSVSGYSRTVNLNSHAVNNWYDWYYEPLLQSGDVVISDIPPYATGVLTITAASPGGTARLGCCKIGKSRTLGTTHNDLSRSIADFSRATADSFGDVDLIQGLYSKRLNLQVQVASGMESEIARLLELYRSTPMIFVGSESVSMTLIYGFLGAWEMPMPITGRPARIEIKGLI